MIWTLILHYQISLGFGLSDAEKGKDAPTPKQALTNYLKVRHSCNCFMCCVCVCVSVYGCACVPNANAIQKYLQFVQHLGMGKFLH